MEETSFKRAYEHVLNYRNYMIFFGTKDDFSLNKSILLFDLDKQEWGSATSSGDSQLMGSLGYSICLSARNQIILSGLRLKSQKRIIQNMNDSSEEELEEPIRIQDGQRGTFGWEMLIINEQKQDDMLSSKNEEWLNMEWREIRTNTNIPALQYHTANVHENKLYLFGGKNQSENNMILNKFIEGRTTFNYQRFIPSLNEHCITPRFQHSSVQFEEKIYYYGGIDREGRYLGDMWSLDVNTQEWQEIDSKSLVPTPRANSIARVIGDTIIILGGNNRLGNCRDLVTFQMKTHIWNRINNEMYVPGAKSAFVIYQNRLIFGQDFKFFSADGGMIGKSNNMEASIGFQANDRQLFIEKEFADITFIVEGQQIQAHKALISARCSHFKNMFQSGMKEANNTVINVLEMKAVVFNAFLEYLYCGEVENLSEDIAVELLKLSDKYSMNALLTLCENFLIERLRIENIVDLNKVADMYSATKLKDACLKFMTENFDAIFEQQDIKVLPSATLIQLFKQKFD